VNKTKQGRDEKNFNRIIKISNVFSIIWEQRLLIVEQQKFIVFIIAISKRYKETYALKKNKLLILI